MKKTKKAERRAFAGRLAEFLEHPIVKAIILTFWAWFSIEFVSFVAALILGLLVRIGLVRSHWLNYALAQLIYSTVVYVASIAFMILVPAKLKKMRTSREELGLQGLPTWTDLILAPCVFVAFMVVAGLLMGLLQAIFPNANWEQAQEIGFDNIYTSASILCAFITLVILAPVAEELIFRGWLYGELRGVVPALPAIALTSLLFAIVHGQLNVAVVVGLMSVAMCLMREVTGTIWCGMLIHMLKNAIAFYVLFILKIF